MKKVYLLYAVLVVAILVALLAGRGGEEEKIRAQLERLEELIEKSVDESDLESVDRARRLGELFAADFELRLDPVGQTVGDVQALGRPFVGLRRGMSSIEVSFDEEELEVDGDLGRADMVTTAVVSGQRAGGGSRRGRYRATIGWLLEDGEWRMQRVRVEELEGGLF